MGKKSGKGKQAPVRNDKDGQASVQHYLVGSGSAVEVIVNDTTGRFDVSFTAVTAVSPDDAARQFAPAESGGAESFIVMQAGRPHRVWRVHVETRSVVVCNVGRAYVETRSVVCNVEIDGEEAVQTHSAKALDAVTNGANE